MKKVIVTRVLSALAMDRLTYNEMRGWELPKDEDGSDEGVLLEDTSVAPNTPDYTGYVSWIPLTQFHKQYKASGNMTFGQALEILKLGAKVARAGWNGKGMWLVLQPTTPDVTLTQGSVYQKAGLDLVTIDAHIDMYTANGTMQPGWLASQADMLSEDWCIVE